MNNKPAPLPYHEYASFLLRLWQKHNDQEEVWIASLQSTATGESFAFPNMEAFLQFFQIHFMAGQTSTYESPYFLPHAKEQAAFQGDEK